MSAESSPVDVLAGPYRVAEVFFRGANLPRYIVIGRGNQVLRTSGGRRKTFRSEAAAQMHAATLRAVGGDA